jgi:hypothetical protein
VNSSELHNFALANNWTVFDYIYYTGKYLAANDAATAEMLLTYWPQTAKQLDENYYQYYNWITNMKLDKTYKPNLADVLALANKCPQKSGKVVYAARALYNGLTHNVHIFNNDCSGGVASRKTTASSSNLQNPNTVLVYPNPVTNGNFNVVVPKSTAKEALVWYVTITDMYGKTIQQQHLNNAQTSIKINTAKGIYMVTMYNKNSGKQITTKIVVQ